jgi:hypothetical protein
MMIPLTFSCSKRARALVRSLSVLALKLTMRK